MPTHMADARASALIFCQPIVNSCLLPSNESLVLMFSTTSSRTLSVAGHRVMMMIIIMMIIVI